MASRQDLSETLASLVEGNSPSVVRVEARHRTPSTGVVWSKEGVLVTAHHTVERDEGIEVGFADGRVLPATLVGRDPGIDIAVLKVAETELTPPNWSDAEGLKVGHLALAIARPGRTARATMGVVSALGADWRTPSGARLDRYLETDLELRPGFSGSLLVDLAGRAIGINTSALWRGHSLTISTGALRRTVDALLAHGRIRRGFVGVGAFPVRLPAKLEQQAGQSTGLLVIAVQPNSPAEQGGLTLGDALLSVDGRPLGQVDDLLEALTDAVDKDLKLRVLRAGQIQELGVRVGTRG